MPTGLPRVGCGNGRGIGCAEKDGCDEVAGGHREAEERTLGRVQLQAAQSTVSKNLVRQLEPLPVTWLRQLNWTEPTGAPPVSPA